MRAVAAMAVMVGHARNLFFVDYPAALSHGTPVRLVYFLSGFGHEAVIVFFVLSGLLVGAKAATLIEQDRWSWRRYLIERCSRLCVVLWPALLLTFFWDWLGMHLFGIEGIYGGHTQSNVVPLHLAAHSSPQVYLANALFLQGVLTPTAGTNTPLWSLSNEFWYYLAFPALLLIFSRGGSRLRRAKGMPFLVLAGSVVFFKGMLGGFLIWILGTLCAKLAPWWSSSRRPTWTLAPAAAIFAGVLVLSRVLPSFAYKEQTLGIAAAYLCLWNLMRSQGAPGSFARQAAFLSSFSYTLYLTHLPLLVIVRASMGQAPRWQPDLLHLPLGALICGAAAAWAYLVYRVTEAHTPRVRAFLLNRLVPHSASSTPSPRAPYKSSAAAP